MALFVSLPNPSGAKQLQLVHNCASQSGLREEINLMLGLLGTLEYRAYRVHFQRITAIHNSVQHINNNKKKVCMIADWCVACKHGPEGEHERDPGYGLEPAVGV